MRGDRDFHPHPRALAGATANPELAAQLACPGRYVRQSLPIRPVRLRAVEARAVISDQQRDALFRSTELNLQLAWARMSPRVEHRFTGDCQQMVDMFARDQSLDLGINVDVDVGTHGGAYLLSQPSQALDQAWPWRETVA
jgi:hypothetical protein